jgi:hypothetical protein
MLLSFALGFAVVPIPVADTVSLRKTAQVSVLLEDLSRRSELALTTGPKLGKEVLIVAIDGVPLKEAMDKIAWATFGRWQQSGAGYRLVQDTDAERAAERRYVKWQTGEAAATLGAYRARVLQRNVAPELNQWQLERQGRRAGGPPTPIERLLAQALGAVKPETIIFTRPNAAAVYSNRPTEAEMFLGNGFQEILRTYNDAVPVGEPAAYAVLTCEYVFERATATLKLFSEKGYSVGETSATFSLYGPDTSPRAKEFADEVPETLVPLSEDSKFLKRDVRMINGFPFVQDMAQMPELTARMRDPERYEPMATFTTDVWRTVAASKGLNLVANVDDVYLFPGSWATKTPSLGEAFRMAGGYNAEVSKGWMVARPSIPNAPWHHRIDRAALARLAKARPATPFAQFEAWADYAGAQKLPPDPYTTNQILAWMGLPTPNLYTGWFAPRLYGSLTPQMRADWKAGRGVMVENIPLAAKQALSELVFSQYIWRESRTGFSDRPTAVFPLGLPDRGMLSGGFTSTAGYNWRLANPDRTGWSTVVGIGDFVRRLEASGSARLNTLELQPVMRQDLNLLVAISDRISVEVAKFQEPGTPQGRFTAWNQMPAGVKDQIRQTGK